MQTDKIKSWRTEHKLSLTKMADRMTAILALRPYPPQRVHRQLLWLWEQGRVTDHTAVVFEILASNETDPELAELAQSVLQPAE